MIGFIVDFTYPLPALVLWQQPRIVPANDIQFVSEYETLSGYGNLGYGVSYGG